MGKYINDSLKDDLKDGGILFIIILMIGSLIASINSHNLTSSNTAILLGVFAFIIPILLAFSRRFNLATRFGNGEVRKAIVISLTIVYIILLSAYFFNVTLPIGEKFNNSLGGLGGSGLNDSKIKAATGSGVGKTNVTINEIPSEALKDISTNFFWVYALIIIFYFGSRAWESVAETNMVKDLKEINPQELLQRRYILGSISPENFRDMNGDIMDGAVILVDANPVDKAKDKYDLIVRNMGSKERMVNKWTVNTTDATAGESPINISGGSYRTIRVNIPAELKIKPQEDKVYTFEITLDTGDTYGIKRS